MPRYRVTNRITKEVYDVEAPFAQDACERLGWLIGDCYVELLRESPFTDISASPASATAEDTTDCPERLQRLEERVRKLEDRVRLMDEALEGVYFRG